MEKKKKSEFFKNWLTANIYTAAKMTSFTILTSHPQSEAPAELLISRVSSILHYLSSTTNFHDLLPSSAAASRILPDATQCKQVDGRYLHQLTRGECVLGQVAAKVLLQFVLDGRGYLQI